MSYERALEKIKEAKEKNLITLNLSHLNCKKIPSELFELTNLTELNLRNNQLEILPKEIGNLNNLVELYLFNNQLKKIPKEIGNLTNLNILDLSNNELTRVPKEIENLTNLNKLYLENNYFLTNTPYEILSKHPKDLIAYLIKNQSSDTKILNEAKVLFVGEGGVGKTSLINRILYDTFNQSESKTDGIKINRFNFGYKNEKIKLNIWDFGGQEIMHSTHQFFLTNRSLYILVWDARQEDRYGLVEYWLELIKSFGGESPILVIMNKVDEHNGNIDKVFLKEKYPNIKGFLNTSCKDNYNIDKLIDEIKKFSLELPHIRDELPIDWFNIKDKLEELKKQNVDFISYDEYIEFCENENITESKERRLLIDILHDLGIILNFRDDLRLKDIGIINPLWVTDGVYKILNSEILTNQNGLLYLRNLEAILEEHRDKYPSNRDITLIDMMRKFELCFEIDRNSVLVPEALPKETPKLNWNKKDSLAFMYQYNFLPQSVISRFIVKSHEMIEDSLMWRSGVVLKNGKQKALIQADRKDKKIFIYIDDFGTKAREFLAVIRNIFLSIHKTIKTIEPKEKIPLPDNHKISVNYEDLLFWENKGDTYITADGARKKYNISKLLNNIENKNIREELYVKKEIHLHNGDYYEKPKQNVKNGNAVIGGENHTIIANNFSNELNKKVLELIKKIKESEISDKNEIIEEIENTKDKNSLKDVLLNLLSRAGEIGSIIGGSQIIKDLLS